MKVICMNGEIDIDVLNNYKPDGIRPAFQCDVGTYKLDTMSEKELGTFLRTSDNGAIYFTDIVFKILMDMAIKLKLPSGKYIYKEIRKHDEPVFSRPNQKKTFGKELAKHGVKNVMAEDCERIVGHNLKVLSNSNMIMTMCPDPDRLDPEYIGACVRFIEFLGERIYLNKDLEDFWSLHNALTELFCTYDTDDVKVFLENFYEILDKIPEIKYTEKTAGTLERSEAPVEDGLITSAEDDHIGQIEKQDERSMTTNQSVDKITENVPSNADSKKEAYTKQIKTISGSDITGFDETYAAGYCEAFYDKEIERADSEGFLEKLIIARSNGTAAPLDLLSEAIQQEHEKDTPANLLRKNIEHIRNDVEAATVADGAD